MMQKINKLKKQRAALIICLALSMILHLAYGIEGMNQMDELENELFLLEINQSGLESKNAWLEVDNDILGRRISEYKEMLPYIRFYQGEFEITYYTAGPESTGKTPEHPAYGITASGTTVTEGQTIAADWTVLEPGTKVFIEGIGIRTVEDKGGAIKGNCIDVYVEDVEVARQLGRHKATVYVLEEIDV